MKKLSRIGNLRCVRRIPDLPRRPRNGHKGTFGRVLIVGGCRGMAGAPCLAARAALRSGAGLVKVIVPEPIWDLVAAKLDECTTGGRPATRHGTFARAGLVQIWKEEQAKHDVTVLGMGLGANADPVTAAETRVAVAAYRTPLVLDADGLNAFPKRRLQEVGRERVKALRLEVYKTSTGREASGCVPPPLVLTPHPGEAARMLDRSVSQVEADRQGSARELAALAGPGAVVVLKGAGTVVTDGARVYVNTTGNPGMGTGGSGDVLAGIVGALLGQRMSGFDSAVLGVYLHGLAGDLAAARLGEHSLIAGDLIEALPEAFVKHGKRRR
ncbi:MAG: NAD(P)H-hydrate dehydratase [Planctomycetes bacterium]|nr:NAD(P)H-hydrate dehydratase [Planctomycetota bacterium]